MTLLSRRSVWMTLLLGSSALAASFGEAQSPPGPSQSDEGKSGGLGRAVARRPGRKNVLAWIDSRSSMQSHAASVLERLGYEAGIYDTYIRTNAQAAFVPGNDNLPASEGSELDGFDGIVFLGSRETDLPAPQRAQLLSFIRDGGAFVGAHAATAAFMDWPQFHEMLGGRWQAHPWGKTDLTLLVEDPTFPGMQQLPRIFTRHDETYEMADLSREKLDVIVRIDATHLDQTKPQRKDGDFPMVWAKNYGKGRVYSNALGHYIEAWDDPVFQKMYFEAIKWALGLTDARTQPHPLVKI
jgi:uncharacterized protein